MKYRLIQITLLFVATSLSGKLIAQNADTTSHQKVYISNSSFRTWSIGVSGGIATPYTLIGYNSRQDFTSPDMQLGYAIYFKDQLTNSFGLQADLMMGKLKADHSNERYPNGAYLYEQSDTKLNWSASLSGNFTIFHTGILQPYLTLGGGIVSYSPILHAYYKTQTVPVYGTLNSFFVPVGLGLKLNITQGINLDLGYQVNFAMTDNLDGYTYGPTNDRFSYSHIGLEFAIGKRTKKQLGAQAVSVAVQNRTLAREQALKDELSSQQNQLAAEKSKNGRLENNLEAANADLARLTTDSDGDGIPDIYDKCPNTPPDTKVDASGCPLNTSLTAAGAKAEVTDEDKRNLLVAAASVEFYAGTEIISGRSFPNLDVVARLMKERKFSLKIDVYTTKNAGSDSDLRLAKLRATAVKNYFVNRGIDESRIQTDGHNGFPADAKRHKQFSGGLVEFTIVK